MRMDLDNWKEKLSRWTSRMEGMHKEREAALTRDKEAHEKRIALAEKLKQLDEEILASLRLDTRLPTGNGSVQRRGVRVGRYMPGGIYRYHYGHHVLIGRLPI